MNYFVWKDIFSESKLAENLSSAWILSLSYWPFFSLASLIGNWLLARNDAHSEVNVLLPYREIGCSSGRGCWCWPHSVSLKALAMSVSLEAETGNFRPELWPHRKPCQLSEAWCVWDKARGWMMHRIWVSLFVILNSTCRHLPTTVVFQLETFNQIPVKAQVVQTGKEVSSPSHTSNDHLQLLFWKTPPTKKICLFIS